MAIRQFIVSVSLICFASSFLGSAAPEAAAPSIRLNGKMDPLFDILTNVHHGWTTDTCGFVTGHAPPPPKCGNARPFKAWVDGPMNPYRHGGHTYFQLPHSENYRIKVPNHNWGNRQAWTMEGDAMASARRAEEGLYDNRHWIFAVRNVNGTLYALTHHEWYKDRIAVGGIQGFLAPGEQSQWWIAAIGWAKSTNGGLTWQMNPTAEGSRRLVIVPQPSGGTTVRKTYGFAHPSNVVWDAKSQNYYVFASSLNHKPGESAVGVILLRTRSIEKPTGWEFWNGSGWTVVNQNTYQGNFGSQMPYLFWRDSGAGCGHLYALNVRRHKPSGKWIVLGHKWCTPSAPCWEATFAWTSNLAQPTDLERSLTTVSNPPGTCITGRPYYSFFDTDGSADDNYQEVGNNPLLVSVDEQGRYFHQFLTLSGF